MIATLNYELKNFFDTLFKCVHFLILQKKEPHLKNNNIFVYSHNGGKYKRHSLILTHPM